MNDCVHCCDLGWDELPPAGNGAWRGEVRDDPTPVLTWSLSFSWPLSGSVDVAIEGIPATGASWREIEGTEIESTELGEPIVAWVYDGCHFEFEYARIRVLRRVGTAVRFSVELAECDEDFEITLPNGETVETYRVDTTVDAEFEGIVMFTTENRDLAEFTDAAGLVFDTDSGFYRPVD